MFARLLLLIEKLFRGKGDDAGTVLLVRTLHAPDGRHRACFFHRKEDGVYGYREEYFDTAGTEAHWVPMRHGHVEEYASMDDALAAARAEIHWLRAAE